MFLFWKKEQSILKKINNYLNQLNVCKDQFIICITKLINKSTKETYDECVLNVHKAESEADDFRREIEFELYNRALIPDLRGDVLGLIESVDKIPTYFQSICYMISLEQIQIPKELVSLFHCLIKANIEAYLLINTALKGFFLNKDILNEIQEVDNKESESDKVARELIKNLFELEIDKADKILVKDVIKEIGSISDQAQLVSDRLTIAVVKRKI